MTGGPDPFWARRRLTDRVVRSSFLHASDPVGFDIGSGLGVPPRRPRGSGSTTVIAS